MRFSTTTYGMILAALSIGDAMAGPTHAHLHRNAHKKKDVDYAKLDWDNMGINWSAAWAAGQASKTSAAATPATTKVTAAASPAKTTAAASSSGSSGSSSTESIVDDIKDLWEGLVGAANSRTSFGSKNVLGGGSSGGAGLAGDFQNGNIGSPYGSNMMKVASTSGYDFTNTFVNTQSKTITINIWNKGGPDMQPLSGASLAPKDTSLTFTLASGASQVVAFMDASYVGWAQPCSDLAFAGFYATSWGEAKFESTGGGYDLSAINNKNGNNYDMAISSKEVECISDMTQNYWLTATQPIGGSDGSCYVPGSTMHLTTKMGGSK